MTYQMVYAAMIIFCAGLFLTIASKNILKIFTGLLTSYSAIILLLHISSNPFNITFCTILSILAPVITFIGVFIITKIYKKFKTLEANKIEKIIKEEK